MYIIEHFSGQIQLWNSIPLNEAWVWRRWQCKLNVNFEFAQYFSDSIFFACCLVREGNSPDHHQTITYSHLLSHVCRCANVLKKMGEKYSK